MKRFIVIFFIALFPILFSSCDKSSEPIGFFEKQERDPRFVGTWKKENSTGPNVEVLDFIANGYCSSNIDRTLRCYYTKGKTLHLLKVKQPERKNTPTSESHRYLIKENKLYLDFEGKDLTTARAVYTKL